MEWQGGIILFLGATSIAGIVCIVKLLFVIEDLRAENAKLNIDLLHR